MDTLENSYAVILAGGGGTRLWPKSRKDMPKHFIKVLGEDTMLQTTYQRVQPLFNKNHVLVITNQEHVGFVKKQLPDLADENIIAEPFPNNTALAMGVAAAYVHSRDPKGVLIYFAADHIIRDLKKLKEAVYASLEIAVNHDYLVAVGIKPSFAHTGLGYIRVGQEIGKVKVSGEEVFSFKVRGFKEKPNLATAQSFLASGEYLWNANLYCWSTQAIFDAFKRYHTNIYKGLNTLLRAIGTKDEAQVLGQVYKTSENIQIDYAVSEKANNIVVVPGEFDWSDIGDWQVVYEMEKKDNNGVVTIGENPQVINIESKDLLLETNGRLVAIIGLKDIVIVDTKDALLVCRKDQAQDVKKVVEILKETKKDKYL